MSVYTTKKSRYFQYDFTIAGDRFHGSTGQVTRRAAEAAERRLRIEAGEGKLGEASSLTLDQAAGKWWEEVGCGRADAADVKRHIDELLVLMGKDVRLAKIDTALISEAIQKRRGRTYTKSKANDARRYLPSNATVNRAVIETIRPILRRAAINWGAKGLPGIAWKDLRLTEPKETVRTYSAANMARWKAECGPVVAFALSLLLRYGLRLGELFFHPDQFEPDSEDGPRLVIVKRKRDVPLVLPLRQEDALEIAARVGRARAAKFDHIWFVEVPRDHGEPELAQLTYYGLQSRLNGAATRAGITVGRRIHGARHHAGTTILRNTNNLRLAQKLLGHADIKSTMRYAHALDADLRKALEDDGPTRNSPGASEGAAAAEGDNTVIDQVVKAG